MINMKITEQTAKQLFREKYPNGVGYDFAGRKMSISNYGDSSKVGWDVDHILPVSKGGTDAKENLQCTNVITNDNKANNTTWNDNGKTWQVRRVKGNRKKYIVVEIEQ